MPGWDNTARRGASGTVFMGSSPARYERWLASIASNFRPFSPDENLIFVNAWNEWGEGAHLEPDTRWGQGYLERHLTGTGR
jgi:lipopolysaccharide biosynthesis protein